VKLAFSSSGVLSLRLHADERTERYYLALRKGLNASKEGRKREGDKRRRRKKKYWRKERI